MPETEKRQAHDVIRPVVAVAGPAQGPGLVAFRDRVEAVGGTLRIQSRAGRLVELPLVAPRS